MSIKYRKIRGHKRRQRRIEAWKSRNLKIDLYHLERYNYDYTKIIIHPWCDISLIDSQFPEPKGETRKIMLEALIDIYHLWKKQLDEIGKPYYLKIWLNDPKFSKSQVVCAIGERMDYYNNLFLAADVTKQLNTTKYGRLKRKLDDLNWQHRLDEDFLYEDHVGEPEDYYTYQDYIENKKWFTKEMKKPHRTIVYVDGTKCFGFVKGNIWVGG